MTWYVAVRSRKQLRKSAIKAKTSSWAPPVLTPLDPVRNAQRMYSDRQFHSQFLFVPIVELEDDYDEDAAEGDDGGESPEPESEDRSGPINKINQMTMCIRGKQKSLTVAASSSSTLERCL